MHLSLMFYHHPVPPPPRRNPGFSPKCFCLLATFAAAAHRNIINIQGRREWPALLKSMSEYWPNIDAQSHTAYKYREHSCGTNITHKQIQKQTLVKIFFTFFLHRNDIESIVAEFFWSTDHLGDSRCRGHWVVCITLTAEDYTSAQICVAANAQICVDVKICVDIL